MKHTLTLTAAILVGATTSAFAMSDSFIATGLKAAGYSDAVISQLDSGELAQIGAAMNNGDDSDARRHVANLIGKFTATDFGVTGKLDTSVVSKISAALSNGDDADARRDAANIARKYSGDAGPVASKFNTSLEAQVAVALHNGDDADARRDVANIVRKFAN